MLLGLIKKFDVGKESGIGALTQAMTGRGSPELRLTQWQVSLVQLNEQSWGNLVTL